MCAVFFFIDVRLCFFFFQAEDGIRDAQESRGLGDVYKRQAHDSDEPELVDEAFLLKGLHQVFICAGGQCAEHLLSLIHI